MTETLNGHQLRSQLSTKRLLHVAGDQVAESGYASMTLATVGERAGYSRSLATARFGSQSQDARSARRPHRRAVERHGGIAAH